MRLLGLVSLLVGRVVAGFVELILRLRNRKDP